MFLKKQHQQQNLLMALEQIFPVLMDRWAVGQLCVSLESNCRMNY